MIISLTGFMGCGKSTVAKVLGKTLGMKTLDLDREIALRAGVSIPRIFELGGEQAFRDMEYDTLMECLNSDDVILSLGGGTITVDKSREEILSRTRCVYLHASLEQIEKNLEKGSRERPLYENRRELYYNRLPVYRLAPMSVDVDGKTPRQIAEEIAGMLK